MRICSLHEAALKTEKTGEVKSILEISTKSEIDLGTNFSAFNLRLRLDNDLESSVEGWYQSSKLFSTSGPHPEWRAGEEKKSKKHYEMLVLFEVLNLMEKYCERPRRFIL